jgi:F0F1-type ATP synthase assembly protein I
LLRLSGIAFEIVAFNLIVIWGGYELDQYFDFRIPWMIITALLLAITGTIYFIFNRLNKE